MFVIKFKKLFIGLSVFFVVAAITALIVFGLPLGIDFKGGSALELQYTGTLPNINTVTTPKGFDSPIFPTPA